MKRRLRKLFDIVSLPICRTRAGLYVLRVLAYQRTRSIRRLAERRLYSEGSYGDEVMKGPFKGIKYLPLERYASCRFQKIIGSYEHEIMPWLEELAATKRYTTIINVGAAEGYFTVGFAKLFPEGAVISYETSQDGRDYCRELVKLNGYTDRVTIHGSCGMAEFSALNPALPSFVMMDIELGERLLLDLDRVPWLRHAAILVETHDGFQEGTTQLIIDRFANSHNIRQVTSGGLSYADYPILRPLRFEQIDALVGEDRPTIQDWLLMEPKA